MRRAPILLLCTYLAACSAAPRFEPSGVSEMETLDAGLDDGGVDAGVVTCETLDFSAPDSVRARYILSFFGGANTVELRNGSDVLSLELWYRGLNEQATFPWPVMLWPTHRAECETCVSLRRDCRGNACARTFFAIGGQVTFDRATRDLSAGEFAGNASVLRLAEWDLQDDEPMRGGACVELRSVSFDGGWTADGGT